MDIETVEEARQGMTITKMNEDASGTSHQSRYYMSMCVLVNESIDAVCSFAYFLLLKYKYFLYFGPQCFLNSCQPSENPVMVLYQRRIPASRYSLFFVK